MAVRSRTTQNTTQTERAYEALKRTILRGEVPEGEFLSEPEMMRRLGVGRTPYREACNRLHHEGILEVVPRRGYLVPELSFHQVRDLFETRLLLESNIAELAAARATAEEMTELDKLVRRLAATARPGVDMEEVIRANNEFHLLLAKATRNRELLRLLAGNLDHTLRLMYVELRSPQAERGDPHGFHAAIAAAIRARDAKAAREAVLRDIADGQAATFGRWNHLAARKAGSM